MEHTNFHRLQPFEQTAVLLSVFCDSSLSGVFVNTNDHPRFPQVAYALPMKDSTVHIRTGMWYNELNRWCGPGEMDTVDLVIQF